MRIIAGIYRGKKLLSPASEKVRPTSDRAREAIFNILYSKLPVSLSEVNLLDVFSGSGAFALEAVSRGVQQVGMIDIDTKDLLKNVALFPNEKNKIKVMKLNAENLPQASVQYDLLFMDAPYHKGLSEKALCQLAEKGWLKKGALCVVETERSENLILPEQYELSEERFYGVAKVTFLTYKA